MYDDLFSLDGIEIIVRIDEGSLSAYNRLNGNYPINKLREELEKGEVACVFQKLSDVEHRIVIPVLDGIFELVVKQHLSETYEALVNQKRKTVFKKGVQKSNYQGYKEAVCIKLIDLNEKGRATDEFITLYDKINQLEVSSNVNIEEQHNIWFKWIRAQRAIISNLQKTYEIQSAPQIQPFKNENGNITRYSVSFKLAHEILPEYRQLEERLKSLGIEDKFDAEGNVFLNRESIQVLDAVIEREFKDQLERVITLGAIVKLKPLSISKEIQRKLSNQAAVFQNSHKGILCVSSRLTAQDRQLLEEMGFVQDSFFGSFTIINHGSIKKNIAINNAHNLSFVRENNDNTKEIILPEPQENEFWLWRKDVENITVFKYYLESIYGKESVRSIIYEGYRISEDRKEEVFNRTLNEEFWMSLKRRLYVHNLEESLNEFTQSIYVEHESEDELNSIMEILQMGETCDIVKSPLDLDFKFKVKTNVIAKKTETEVFLERLKALRGVEFALVNEKGRLERNGYIGKLDANKSNLEELVMVLPNFFKNDQYKAKEALKLLSSEMEFKGVGANLIGDETKMKWLEGAVKKITSNSEDETDRPVNERLGEFLFDSSKANPIHDEQKVTIGSEYYQSVKRNELLNLNESQRKTVLAAIHCTDLALLQGPPGTGKTTVIAEIIWQILIRNSKHRVLLTSETNLAVDNALDRLLNTRGVNSELTRYTTLIKPLRFGKIRKLDEEGAKYSVNRIMSWLDESYHQGQGDEEQEVLEDGDEDAEENGLASRPENNAVRSWMIKIADKSRINDPKYAEVLKDWSMEMSYPTQEVKELFVNKYIEYANVFGSTCSSTGSPVFQMGVSKANLQENLKAFVSGGHHEESLEDMRYQLMNPSEKNQKFINFLLRRFKLNKTEFARNLTKPGHQFLQDLYIFELEQIKNDIEKNKTHRHLNKLINRHGFESKQQAIEFINEKFTPNFDTVIMDEASKATPPELALPLCFGKRSIIIGDHRQLPPMLNEKDFREALIDAGENDLADAIDREFTETSQFERMILNPNVPKSIISRCNIQYRMHPDINDVIRQFYLDEGGLEPATELVTNADDADLNNIFSRHHGLSFEGFIDPNVHTIWIDVKSPEMREGTSLINEGETKAIRKVIELLSQADGFDGFQSHWNGIKDEFKRKQEQEIGVISFYGSQKRLIKRRLRGLGIPLKINTVDRFQGMERNIVIVSTVRSHQQIQPNRTITSNHNAGFAKSPQRLNVALSRARRLLIVVGNKTFFERVKDKNGKLLYKNAIAEIERSGRVIDFDQLQKQFS